MRRNVLNITASDVKDAKLTATVTIPAADVDAAIKKAYKDTAKKYRFPGFRAGKAPRPVIDSALGAEATLAQATNDLIAANEPAVLNELDIVPTKNGDYKELDLAKDHEDYTYTVEFSLRPAAELSSFDAVEIEMPPAEVTESEINNQVEMLLNYRATFEDVEGRAVEADDYVTVDLKAVENADNFAAEGRMLIAGNDSNPAEFNEALIGANVDDVKTVTWTDEVEEGEEAETHTVEVTVKGIKVRNTPELTDELVKSDFGFDSIDAMRDAIKIEIEQDKASRLPAEKENRCVSALAERLQRLLQIGSVELRVLLRELLDRERHALFHRQRDIEDIVRHLLVILHRRELEGGVDAQILRGIRRDLVLAQQHRRAIRDFFSELCNFLVFCHVIASFFFRLQSNDIRPFRHKNGFGCSYVN